MFPSQPITFSSWSPLSYMRSTLYQAARHSVFSDISSSYIQILSTALFPAPSVYVLLMWQIKFYVHTGGNEIAGE